ncbi:DUF3192 domain-containing protein [Shewanella avicenniae]|uniref:DUF3192 domain-containing protein n=1 Tax=Shewanella avicenniae TaxID=2814294 RepID=A0ABX7QNE7_9GAMM|nr:DUF3192 domain-containing protein [Shewanella avicenniae]QSX32542.1 DUF3192 domain-containing protein [Shewanella avicenniae]
MNKILLPLLGLASLSLTACVVKVGGDSDRWDDSESWKQVQRHNQQILSQLDLGMSVSQVEVLMGTPDFNEAFASSGEKVQVLFYRTQHAHSDGKTTKDECTPLIFRSDKLAGWGDKAYQQL